MSQYPDGFERAQQRYENMAPEDGVECPNCNGTGVYPPTYFQDPPKEELCQRCGNIARHRDDEKVYCSACGGELGTSEIPYECRECDGQGLISRDSAREAARERRDQERLDEARGK